MQLLIHVFIVDQLLCEIVLSKINSALIGNDCIYCYFIRNDLFYCIVSGFFKIYHHFSSLPFQTNTKSQHVS